MLARTLIIALVVSLAGGAFAATMAPARVGQAATVAPDVPMSAMKSAMSGMAMCCVGSRICSSGSSLACGGGLAVVPDTGWTGAAARHAETAFPVSADLDGAPAPFRLFRPPRS